MASLCKKQQCTIDRRGFRQELDSWRHKLIHCVGKETVSEIFHILRVEFPLVVAFFGVNNHLLPD
uniref:Uncharacterized protein n=1 Tax=Poecilia mexicana TaxID=48701 RepID=A0A3B3WNC9_9TELE